MSLNFKWQVPITSSTIIDLLIDLSISTFYFVHVSFSRIQNGIILERTFHNLVCRSHMILRILVPCSQGLTTFIEAALQ